ncbi:MAG: hypothetical protein NVS3B12_31330 [Acidimicrobiales bacterium]
MGRSRGDIDLQRRWRHLLASWGASPGDVDGAGAAVLSCWAEPHRRYHTTDHLREVLAAVDTLADLANDPVAVELAAWLHDAVYDPTAVAGCNEAASADLGSHLLTRLHVPAVVTAAVHRLIVSTATHEVEMDDPDGAVLTDADLWILGAPEQRYRRYAADVRAEFAFVDEAAWRRGRAAVVGGFAGRSRLFLTDRAQATLGAQARVNLSWELAALGGGEAKARIP